MCALCVRTMNLPKDCSLLGCDSGMLDTHFHQWGAFHRKMLLPISG